MGWLEALALLKRVLPLLGRIAPMLETVIAARAGSRGDIDAALERMAGDVKGHLAATAEKHDSVADLLSTQAIQLAALAESIRKLQTANDCNAARLLEIEAAVGAVSRTVRKAAILLAVLLVACLGLLIAIMRHHVT